MADHAQLVAVARDLIAKIRSNGHDVRLDHGNPSFPLNAAAANAEPCAPRGKGWPSFVLGVELDAYADVFGHADRAAIFAEALGEP